MNALITSAGRRVSLVKAFQQELKKDDADAKVFSVDLQPELSAACQVSDGYFKVPRVTELSYIESLLNICKQYSINIVIPTIDTELPLLTQHKDRFTQEDVHLIISDYSLIETCRDKRKTDKLFKKLDIATPEIFDVEDLKFPVYAKPYDGSSSQNNFIIHENDQLTDEIKQQKDLLFFEYLNHEEYDEYTLDLYYGIDSNLKCIVPRKRIEVRSGEVNKGLTVKNVLVPFVREKMSVLNGARGCITLQLFLNEKNGDIKGIEINPRFGGGYPLSYLAGANYPQWIIHEYNYGKNIDYWDDWENNLLMLRYDEEVLVHGFEN